MFRRYVLGRMTMAEEFTYRDIPGLLSYWKNWNVYHSRTSPMSLVFTKTGEVPLEFASSKMDEGARITEALDLRPNCVRCMSDVGQFCRDVRSAGLPFTLVVGPVRPDLLATVPSVREVVAQRKAQLRSLVQECNGTLFDITDYASLDESCFANTLHLNAPGMRAMTGQFVRFRRGEKIPKGMVLSCGGSPVVPSAHSGRETATALRPPSE